MNSPNHWSDSPDPNLSQAPKPPPTPQDPQHFKRVFCRYPNTRCPTTPSEVLYPCLHRSGLFCWDKYNIMEVNFNLQAVFPKILRAANHQMSKHYQRDIFAQMSRKRWSSGRRTSDLLGIHGNLTENHSSKKGTRLETALMQNRFNTAKMQRQKFMIQSHGSSLSWRKWPQWGSSVTVG